MRKKKTFVSYELGGRWDTGLHLEGAGEFDQRTGNVIDQAAKRRPIVLVLLPAFVIEFDPQHRSNRP